MCSTRRWPVGADRVAVVTSDAALSATVDARGAHGIVNTGDLNAALAHACRFVAARGAQAVMVLPSDLPFVTADDIAALASALAPAPACVIAPDAAEQATNALALVAARSGLLPLRAVELRGAHAGGRARGATIEIVRRPGLAFDLDTPEDYRRFLKRTGTPRRLSVSRPRCYAP